MVTHSCEFCSKTFCKKSNLTVHQRTAKYCISLREPEKVSRFTCENCQKELSTNRTLETHIKTCKTRKEQEVDAIKRKNVELEFKVRELESAVQHLESTNKILIEEKNRSQACVEEIAKQPKTTTNNKTVNKVSILTPLDLSAERLRELVEANFTNSHLLEGQKGVARFTVEHVIKDEDGKLQYICTDPARHTFRFKEGETEVKDLRGKRLSVALAPPVMDKTSRLGMQAIKENPDLFCVYSDSQQNIRDMRDDDAEFRGELASMVG
jgi:hypothetical protein